MLAVSCCFPFTLNILRHRETDIFKRLTLFRKLKQTLLEDSLSLVEGSFCGAWRNSTAFPLWCVAYQILLLFLFCLRFTTINCQDNRMTTVSTTVLHKEGERLWWSFADKPIVPTWLVHMFEQNFTNSLRTITRESLLWKSHAVVWFLKETCSN